MIRLAATDWPALRDWFQPERPGPLIGPHVLNTGYGNIWVARWPEPRTVLVETAGNFELTGDPRAIEADELASLASGFIEAGPDFEDLLRRAFPEGKFWERVVYELTTPIRPQAIPGFTLRRLSVADAAALETLHPDLHWVAKTWGGMAGMAANGYAWSAFDAQRPVAVACTFFLGEQYEDIGVATDPDFRRRGLSAALTQNVCLDIQSRGRRPSWNTSTDNPASMRVAEKLGFTLQRRDRLFLANIEAPKSD
jgi:GNAT superfamily N-acetyltransferase